MGEAGGERARSRLVPTVVVAGLVAGAVEVGAAFQIGRASCRERV